MFNVLRMFSVFLPLLNLAWGQTQCKAVGATCATCTSVGICMRVNGSATVVTCDRPTPYCNAGSCSAVPGTRECLDKLAKFTCPEEDGTYPDGSNCRKYHTCLNGTAHGYDCTVANSVYSPLKESCVRMNLIMSPCYTVKCPRDNKFVTYPGDASIYFLCVSSRPTLVQRCPKGYQYDQSAQKCVVACSTEGRMQDPSGNLTYFIECTLLAGSTMFSTVVRQCPENSKLNVTNLRCSLVPPT